MATQGYKSADSFPLDGAPAVAVGANLIVAMSGVNPGNALLATAGLVNVFGVTQEATDTNGYALVQLQGVAQVIAGGTVTAGDRLMSDAAGKAVTMAPSVAGAGTLKGSIGIARASATNGNLVDVILCPQNLFAA